ncbi:MAG: DsbC family protein [Geobacteraceae bacterium]|nr:DsbC family protein [Geobacteraceae bacterium]
MRILLVILVCLMFAVPAFGFGAGVEGCSGDCTACHKVTREEVKDIFKNIDPAVAVEDVTPAPARGLYQITLKKGTTLQIVYLDFSKNYLLAGQLIDIKSKRDLTRQGVEDATVIDPATIPLDNALVMGNPKGTRVLYLFSDPECPYCGKLHHTVAELVKEDPQLKVYIVLIPLDIHPDSLWKTESIVCKSKEDMGLAIKMLENSYEKKEVPRQSCGKVSGAELKKVGVRLGINVTPTVSFQNGKVFMGARGKDDIRKMLEQGAK